MNPDSTMEGNSHGGGGGVDARLEERTEDGSDVRGGAHVGDAGGRGAKGGKEGG